MAGPLRPVWVNKRFWRLGGLISSTTSPSSSPSSSGSPWRLKWLMIDLLDMMEKVKEGWKARWRGPKWTSGSGNSYTWKNCLHEPSCKALSSLLWPLLIFSLSPLGSVRLIYIGCKKFQRLGNGHDSLPSLSFQITHGNPYKPWFTLKYDYIIGLRWVKCNPQSFLLCWKGRFHPPAWREAFDNLSTLNETWGVRSSE